MLVLCTYNLQTETVILLILQIEHLESKEMATCTVCNILIGGGSGFIGTNLKRILRNRGYAVTIVSRMPGPNRITWHQLQERGLPPNTGAVVNLAGQNVLDTSRRWTEGFKQNIWNSRVQTTCALAKAITNAPAKPSVFVTISGVGIYDPDREEPHTENSRICEYDYLSKMCVEWEKSAKLPNHVTTRQVTVRSGVVLGRDGGMIKQLYLPFSLGLGGPIAPGNQYLPWIHVGDLTRLFVFILESTNISGVLNGVAPDVICYKEFSDAFARSLGRPAFLTTPQFVLNMMLGEERANMLTKGQNVLPSRTQSLGFRYVFPDIQSACDELANTAAVKEL